MEDIYNELNTYLRGSNKNGLNETIAEFMLAYLNDISQMRASDIAERCHTSTPSVIRFCRELGYEGFADFKDAVDSYCQNVQDKVLVPHAPLRVLGNEAEFQASVENWVKLMQNYALCAMLALDRAKLIELAKDIVRYPHVYVFGVGFSGLVAEQLRLRLARSGKILITSGVAHLDQRLSGKKEETLAVVISQHARIFSGNDLLSFLARNAAKSWLVTQEPQSRKFAVDRTLYVQGDNGSSKFEIEYHTMIYFEELLGECCRQLLEQ